MIDNINFTNINLPISPVQLLFYLFSAVLVGSSLVVVTTRNMVHAAMFLILAFFNAAALFLLMGAEFLAMLLIIVYVGAIAVLFLFVVMMLNTDSPVLGEINRKKPLIALIGFVLFIELFLSTQFSSLSYYQPKVAYAVNSSLPNTENIGNILYTNFALPFQIVGLILFVAMIGAIVLTLKQDSTLRKKQNISKQVERNKSSSLTIVKASPGQGLNI
jgi:NADH-quinone oxidoreductase subunit J